MDEIVVLFSPGLDSYLTSWNMDRMDIPHRKIFFDYNGMYSTIERNFLQKRNYKNLLVNSDLNLKMYEDKETAHLSNRNLLFATMAQSMTGSQHIVLGGVADDRVSDNNKKFYKRASKVLTQSAGYPVNVDSMLSVAEKNQWCKFYKDSDGDCLKLLTETYSCYSSNYKEQKISVYEKTEGNFVKLHDKVLIAGCLNCNACFRKLCALVAVNIYTTAPGLKYISSEYLQKFTLKERLFDTRYKTVKKYNKFLNL